MAFAEWNRELLFLLAEKKLSRDEILSVSLVLTHEEKAQEMITFLKENESLSADEIFQKAGQIAFGKNS